MLQKAGKLDKAAEIQTKLYEIHLELKHLVISLKSFNFIKFIYINIKFIDSLRRLVQISIK